MNRTENLSRCLQLISKPERFIPGPGFKIQDMQGNDAWNYKPGDEIKMTFQSAMNKLDNSIYFKFMEELRTRLKLPVTTTMMAHVAEMQHKDILDLIRGILNTWLHEDVENPPIVDLDRDSGKSFTAMQCKLALSERTSAVMISSAKVIEYPIGYPVMGYASSDEEDSVSLSYDADLIPIKIPSGWVLFAVGQVMQDEDYIAEDGVTIKHSDPSTKANGIILIKDVLVQVPPEETSVQEEQQEQPDEVTVH